MAAPETKKSLVNVNEQNPSLIYDIKESQKEVSESSSDQNKNAKKDITDTSNDQTVQASKMEDLSDPKVALKDKGEKSQSQMDFKHAVPDKNTDGRRMSNSSNNLSDFTAPKLGLIKDDLHKNSE